MFKDFTDNENYNTITIENVEILDKFDTYHNNYQFCAIPYISSFDFE